MCCHAICASAAVLQFMAEGEERYHNRAAVLHLSAPDYATPAVDSFEAVLPRPHVSSSTESRGVDSCLAVTPASVTPAPVCLWSHSCVCVLKLLCCY
jgi:hypothetical protein